MSALADAVLYLHCALVAFIVGGLVVIVIGNLRHWRGVNAPLFRHTHLAAILVVVALTWVGIECPLTTAEAQLRAASGGAVADGDFIAHWVSRLLFWEAPAWVFTSLYTAFAAACVGAQWRWPPRTGSRADSRAEYAPRQSFGRPSTRTGNGVSTTAPPAGSTRQARAPGRDDTASTSSVPMKCSATPSSAATAGTPSTATRSCSTGRRAASPS